MIARPGAVRVRPLRPDDDAVDTVFHGLSARSRRHRFLSSVEHLSEPMRAALLAVDGHRHVALVAEGRVGRGWSPIGIARGVRVGPDVAELAYEVVDDWQGRGVGRRLLTALLPRLRAAGIAKVVATVAHENQASLALLRRVLPQARIDRSRSLLEVSAWLTEPPLTLEGVLADLGATYASA